MPTIGWFEILIVVAIAIVILGPKDFPIMLKKVGSWIGAAKKETFKYVKKVSCKAVNINLLFVSSFLTAVANGSTKNPYKFSAYI